MLIYEELAEYASWFKLLYLIPAGLIVGAIVLAFGPDIEAFFTLIGEGIFVAILFYLIMPRKYQIYQEKLRIVLGASLGFNIPLSTIKEAQHVSGSNAYVFSGIRFATSNKYVLAIVRNKGWNYVISPKNGENFKDRLNQAIKENSRFQY